MGELGTAVEGIEYEETEEKKSFKERFHEKINKTTIMAFIKRCENNGLTILLGALLYGCVYCGIRFGNWHVPIYAQRICFYLAYVLIAVPSICKLIRHVRHWLILDENFLILAATIGTIVMDRSQEGMVVLLFFEVAYYVQLLVLNHTSKAVEELTNMEPSYAIRKLRGKELKTAPRKLKVRNIIIIRPGEMVPIDCQIIRGSTALDMQALTGESMPKDVKEGDRILSGSINRTGMIEARVIRTYEMSAISKISKMVQSATDNKAVSELFITRFSKYYTPIIVVFALLLMILPPMLFPGADGQAWIYRGLIFLVTACPCGMVISIPIAYMGGIRAAAKYKMIVKGGSALEKMYYADTFVFDKTRTLTEGDFEISEVRPEEGITEEELLEMAAYVEKFSNHPIADSLEKAYGKPVDKERVKRVKEVPGLGISATFDRQRIHIGNARMMDEKKIRHPELGGTGTIIYLAMWKRYVGYIRIKDIIKEDASETIDILQSDYQAYTVMLTGDTEATGQEVAELLHMDSYYAGLLPEEKLSRLEDILAVQRESEKVVFIGDGINDTPVIARADVGIAMGGLGADAAIEASDIILLKDEPSRILTLLNLARETQHIVQENIMLAMVIKVVLLIMAAIGYMTMPQAMVAEAAVMLFSVINAFCI